MKPKVFKKLLIDKDTSIAEVARKIGCSRVWLSLVVNGHRKGKKTWPKVAKTLNFKLPEAA